MPLTGLLPRLSRRLLVGVPVATALVSGLAVQGVFVAAAGVPWSWHEAAGSVANAAIYVAVMWPAAVATFRWTVGRWPLRGPGDVLRHVAAQVATTALSFAAASGIVRLLFGSVYPPGLFAIIVTVASVSTAGLATVLYGVLAAQRLRATEAAAVAAELRALRAQINPHFLFNALNTVAALVRTRPERAERVVEDLADLFRYSLAASERPAVTLAEEVASARLFLGIEQARYGDDLTVRVDVPDALGGARVPSLILQPLVENAVKHGVRTRDGRGSVALTARRDGDALVLRVEDSGPGFGTARIEDLFGRGTGLRNVAERLRAGLGARASLAVDSDAAGGAVVVRLPFEATG